MSFLRLTRDPSDAYRAKTQTLKFYSHTRKKCACGQAVTAKQLVQYGKCEKCRGVKP